MDVEVFMCADALVHASVSLRNVPGIRDGSTLLSSLKLERWFILVAAIECLPSQNVAECSINSRLATAVPLWVRRPKRRAGLGARWSYVAAGGSQTPRIVPA